MKAFKKLLLLIYLLSFQVFASDNKSELISESEFFSDIPLLDSVTRLPQQRSATPAAVSIIDREMIKKSGARYFPDLFRLVPGFQVAYARTNRAIVIYHGLGDLNARRMLILIDGRATHGALSGSMDWFNTAIAIADIERIEVIRGASTATYGDNAFRGTINIITQHAEQPLSDNFKSTSGNHNISDTQVRYSSRSTKGAIRATAGSYSEGEFSNQPDDLRIRFFNLRTDWQANLDDSMMIQLGVSNQDAGLGIAGKLTNPPRNTQSRLFFQQFQWRHKVAEDNHLKIHAYHNYLRTEKGFVTDPVTVGNLGTVEIPVERNALEERYDIEAEHTFSFYSSLRLVWGIGIRKDSAQSKSTFSTNETYTNRSLRFFTHAEWQLFANTSLNAGVLWENNDLSNSNFSPRLAVNYQISNFQTFRAIASKAQRTPSIGEEYNNRNVMFMGELITQKIVNKYQLRNETMKSTEIGYWSRFPSIHSTIDIRLYREHIEEYITHTLVTTSAMIRPTALAFRNEGDITIDGIDLELQYQPLHRTTISLTSSFLRVRATNFSTDTVYTSQQFEDSVPKYSGSLALIQRIDWYWNSSIIYYWVDEMLWLGLSTNNNIKRVDSLKRLDLRVARQIHLGNSRGELSFVIQNIGDDYQDYRTNKLFETQAFLSFSLRF